MIMITVKLSDVSRLRSFLNTDRAWADYALGDLEPELFPHTDWYGAEEQGDLSAVAMIYHGLQPPICFLMGDERGVDLILAQAVRLSEIGLSVRDEHLSVLDKYYRDNGTWPMCLIYGHCMRLAAAMRFRQKRLRAVCSAAYDRLGN